MKPEDYEPEDSWLARALARRTAEEGGDTPQAVGSRFNSFI